MSKTDQEWRDEYDRDLGNYFGWRTRILGPALDGYRDISDKDILLFGVFGGKTTIEICQLLLARNLSPRVLWCFDSFQGIPLETAEPVQNLWNPEKSEFFQAFNAQSFFNVKDVESTVAAFTDRVTPWLPQCGLNVVSGFFDLSLTDEVALQIQNPLAIVVDVDTYSSTKTLLDWVIKNNLMVPGQTLVGYDDWGGTPGFETMSDGESRAHREMIEQTGWEFERIGGAESVVFKRSN